MSKTKLAVLFGGASSEHEVSLMSAYAVLKSIDRALFDVTMIGITADGSWHLYDGDPELIPGGGWQSQMGAVVTVSPSDGKFSVLADGTTITLDVDAVFPVLHGKFGEDGTIQGLFELCGIPVVGCNCASSAVCMDKAFTKRTLISEDIPQARAAIISEEEFARSPEKCLDAAESAAMGYPIFVKPARAGSSVGVSRASDRSMLAEAFARAFHEDSKLLAEQFISGREIEVAVLKKSNGETVVSACGEINPGSDFYDYDTKYKLNTASYYIPARLTDEESQNVRSLAAKIFTILDCNGFARVDFFVTDDGKAIFNEINTIPGFTKISMYPKLMEHAWIGFTELITLLVDEAIKRK